MKRFIVALLLTLLICTSAFAMKNEPDGFRGIKWGDSMAQHKEKFEDPALRQPSHHDPIGKGPYRIREYLSPRETLKHLLTGTEAGISGVTYDFDEKGFYAGSYVIKDMETIKKELNEYYMIWGKEDTLIEELDDEGAPVVILLWFGEKASALFSVSAGGAYVEISQKEGMERAHKFYEQKAKKDS